MRLHERRHTTHPPTTTPNNVKTQQKEGSSAAYCVGADAGSTQWALMGMDMETGVCVRMDACRSPTTQPDQQNKNTNTPPHHNHRPPPPLLLLPPASIGKDVLNFQFYKDFGARNIFANPVRTHPRTYAHHTPPSFHSPIHPSIHPSIHLIILSLTHPSTHPFTHPLTHPSIHSLPPHCSTTPAWRPWGRTRWVVSRLYTPGGNRHLLTRHHIISCHTMSCHTRW